MNMVRQISQQNVSVRQRAGKAIYGGSPGGRSGGVLRGETTILTGVAFFGKHLWT